MFDLETLEKRFTHVETAIHAFEEDHKSLAEDLQNLATKWVQKLPVGQEVEDFVTLLVTAAEKGHEALDNGAERAEVAAGVVRVNDQAVAGAIHLVAEAPPAMAASSEGAGAPVAGAAPEPVSAPVAPAAPNPQPPVETPPPPVPA